MANVQNSPRGLFAKDAILLPALSAIPTTRLYPGAIRVVSNSTGVAVVLNTTATTWVYLSNTSVQPS
jgi:hypothetical protein